MKKPSIERPRVGSRSRRTVSAALEDLVATRPLQAAGGLPLVVEPKVDGVDLVAWSRAHRGWIETTLREHAGILFRGFGLGEAADLEALIEAVSGELLRYTYRSTPRSRVHGEVYTSTEYPPDQEIPMHNEMSYTTRWPRKIWFLCAHPAQEGGETPIADSREVFRLIDPEVREAFRSKGVMYIRNYGGGLDLPWQEVFQTDDRRQVEEFCRANGIEHEWRGGDRLRTRQVCQAVIDHPETGEPVWFNQAHLFHVSSLPAALREGLLREVAEDELPRHALFGDGSAIGEEALDGVRDAYRSASVTFPWRAGDLLVMDNLLAAHGRRPFRGPRKILVGMAEACSVAEVRGGDA